MIIHNIYAGWRLQLLYTIFKKTVINARPAKKEKHK